MSVHKREVSAGMDKTSLGENPKEVGKGHCKAIQRGPSTLSGHGAEAGNPRILSGNAIEHLEEGVSGLQRQWTGAFCMTTCCCRSHFYSPALDEAALVMLDRNQPPFVFPIVSD